VKFLTHDRDKIGDFQSRVLLHIPIGFLIGLILIIPFVGYGLLKLFIRYEENEDGHTKDQAWKDYFGALVGMGVGIAVTLAGLVYLITRLVN
jgi:hypothetical protein